ncbi:uncharacterized protein LOC114339167 isoform X1 [Diabrotica virgifera virgifera]|uniref:Aromatic amino acid beta-eliminating lyase/threonine aldolase domain-containing protein n=1 Tax=Diabrotica virgifera virgifera TaxID=50390 RepID=A0ABM5KE81_DIAVI|nr:uncharacterized protein LOC114339167 isoform X1 [Diabrotica virgifera virgifera]
MYEKIIKGDLEADVKIIDMRTDTISKPTPEMREAMYAAEVGDDVYGEDPTVTELERRAAELLGKEDAIFVPSGTMANLLAMMVHCPQRGSEIISGDKSHTFLLEQGGAAQLAGIQTRCLKTKDDGTFDLDELREKIKKNVDIHETITSLITVENTHNLCGGRVVPLDWLEKVGSIAAEHDIPVHMDGARMMNAAVYLKVSPRRIVRDVDTACFCLSKGLGCPIGSMLVGPADFINKARRIRKALGGGWRQAGILAAAGLVALDTMIDRLKIDHDHAFKIARAVHHMRSNLFKVQLSKVQTNIILVYIDRTKIDIKEFQRRLQNVVPGDEVRASVRCSSLKNDCVRFVTYHEISEEDISLAIEKIRLVIREYDVKYQLD